MPEPKPTPFYLDKTFLVVILSPLIVFAGKKLGIELNSQEIISFAATVVSFVVMAKWKGAQMAKAAAAGEAEAMKIKTASEALESLAKATGGSVEVYQPTTKKDVQ